MVAMPSAYPCTASLGGHRDHHHPVGKSLIPGRVGYNSASPGSAARSKCSTDSFLARFTKSFHDRFTYDPDSGQSAALLRRVDAPGNVGGGSVDSVGERLRLVACVGGGSAAARRCADRQGQERHPALSAGRGRHPGHVGHEAGRAAGNPRDLQTHRLHRSRRAHLRTPASDFALDAQGGHRPFRQSQGRLPQLSAELHGLRSADARSAPARQRPAEHGRRLRVSPRRPRRPPRLRLHAVLARLGAGVPPGGTVRRFPGTTLQRHHDRVPPLRRPRRQAGARQSLPRSRHAPSPQYHVRRRPHSRSPEAAPVAVGAV